MAIYHISHDGVARVCRASDPSGCRVKLGASIEHYNTREEAQTAYEKSQEKETFFKLSKNPAENTERHYKNISDDNDPVKKRQKANRERYENASDEERARIDKARERFNREKKKIADKKAEMEEIEQQVKEAKKQKSTSKPVKRNSLDIAAEHLQTSQQIEELIDYNNSNRKKDFVFKHNDPLYAEKTPKEKGEFLTDLVNKEDALKKEFDDSKAKNKIN